MVRKIIAQIPREYLIFGGTVFLTIVSILYMGMSSKSAPKEDAFEIGLRIPHNFTLIPIELRNASALSALISDQGIIDVFEGKKEEPLVRNLRVIKIYNDSGTVLGALVANKDAGFLQNKFASPNLRGTLKSLNSKSTVVSKGRKTPSTAVVVETQITED